MLVVKYIPAFQVPLQMYTGANLPTMDIWLCPYVEIQSCSPSSTLVRISSVVLQMPKKVFLRYRP